jgi:hypothetical protein
MSKLNGFDDSVTKVMREDPRQTEEIEKLKNKTRQEQQVDSETPRLVQAEEATPTASRD